MDTVNPFEPSNGRDIGNKCFPENFAKFLRTPFLQNTSGRLLLKI